MTKTTRYFVVSALVLTGLAGAERTSRAADQTTSPGRSNVRSGNHAIRALIVQATEQSATFRSLVATIDASDGFVYVEEGPCGQGVRACFTDLTLVGTHRFLRVNIDLRRADWDVMASIGHELRHTIEVLSVTAVTTRAKMYLFYLREGVIGRSGAFETIAAVQAGDAVYAEVRKFRRARGN